ncbi:hypothetical protein MMC11_007683 [Xylographa trunciseda]|nr:hypothetical protein [Xylographa trunciseda]
MLYRSVNKLLTDLQHPDKSRAYVQKQFFYDVLQPRCYQSFSQVVSDRQFAALGLVLLGVLAEVDAILGAPRSIDDNKASVETEASNPPLVLKGASSLEDFGQRLERPLDVEDDRSDVRRNEEGISTTDFSTRSVVAPVTLTLSGERGGVRSTPIVETKSSGRKALKSRNAIDELFSGTG